MARKKQNPVAPVPQAVTLFLQLAPCPQERIRLRMMGRGKYRRVTRFYPEKTRTFQATIREMVQQWMLDTGTPEFPKDLPLKLEAVLHLPKPPSTKREHPTVRPDLSNYLKALEDGLQRGRSNDPSLLEDDSSIVTLTISKVYATSPDTVGIQLTLGPAYAR